MQLWVAAQLQTTTAQSIKHHPTWLGRWIGCIWLPGLWLITSLPPLLTLSLPAWQVIGPGGGSSHRIVHNNDDDRLWLGWASIKIYTYMTTDTKSVTSEGITCGQASNVLVATVLNSTTMQCGSTDSGLDDSLQFKEFNSWKEEKE